jgi:thioredoxin 2
VTPTFRCTGCGALNRVESGHQGEAPICGRCKKRLDLSGAPQPVSARELDELVARSPVPVLVDFWAPWCGPCRMAAPLLDRVARARPGELVVAKINGDDHPEASSQHGVRGIPTFILFSGGKERARQSGLPPEKAFLRWVEGELDRGVGSG